jgi:hypothetical protein
VGAAFAVPPTTASADLAPTIESESASHITALDATLEATINSQGAEHGVYYQFQLLSGASEYLPELECPIEGFPAGSSLCLGLHSEPGALPIGHVHGASQGEVVHLDLLTAGAKLQPGTTYHYRVIAARALLTEDTIAWEEPIVYGSDQTFTTPPAAAPVIDSASISHLTPTDATLEAQIDTEGLPTIYEFELWSSPCSHHGAGCELIVPIPLLPGLLLGSFVDQSVSLDLNSVGVTLGEGEYGFSVRATNVAGSVSSGSQIFEAPPGVVDPPPPASQPPSSNQPSTALGEPSTALGGGQPIDHPSSSPAPASPSSSGVAPAPPLGTSAGSAAGKRGSHKPRAKRHRHHRKLAKHPQHSTHKH